MPQTRRRTRRKGGKKSSYSVGQINAIIDDFIHPMYSKDEAYRIVDGILHLLVEQNLPLSVRKFILYNLPYILRMIDKKRK